MSWNSQYCSNVCKNRKNVKPKELSRNCRRSLLNVETLSLCEIEFYQRQRQSQVDVETLYAKLNSTKDKDKVNEQTSNTYRIIFLSYIYIYIFIFSLFEIYKQSS